MHNKSATIVECGQCKNENEKFYLKQGVFLCFQTLFTQPEIASVMYMLCYVYFLLYIQLKGLKDKT